MRARRERVAPRAILRRRSVLTQRGIAIPLRHRTRRRRGCCAPGVGEGVRSKRISSAKTALPTSAGVDDVRFRRLVRYVLLDRITTLEPPELARGIKCVSLADDVFVDHFPGHPVMPGVLVVEALAQLAGVLLEATMRER